MLSSKKDGWGFKELGYVETKNIKNEICQYLSEWLLDTSRQEEYETHENTLMYAIRQLDYDYDLISNVECIEKNFLNSANSRYELENIINILEKDANGKAVRIEFINMKPKSRIRTHKDRSDLLYVSRRYHIPIKTNPQVIFMSGKYSLHLKESHIYEINNINYHGVQNHSEENRIHLIVDILPNEYMQNVRFVNER